MDYVDFCGEIIRATAEAEDTNGTRGLPNHFESMILELEKGLREAQSAPAIPDIESRVAWSLSELDAAGLLKATDKHGTASPFIATTSTSRRFLEKPEGTWSKIAALQLEDTSQKVLSKALDVWNWPDGRLVDGKAVARSIGFDTDDDGQMQEFDFALRELDGIGLIDAPQFLDSWDFRPLYAGAVWVTRRGWTEQVRWLREVLERGETVTVDFKRQLSLKSTTDKAEFIKDVLGIINTPGNPPHLLVIGVTNDGQFHAPMDPKIKPEQIDQLLMEWTTPAVSAIVERIKLPEGEVSVIRLERRAEQLPYRATRDFVGKLDTRLVKYRYGTTTGDARPAELKMLDEERERRLRQLGREPTTS